MQELSELRQPTQVRPSGVILPLSDALATDVEMGCYVILTKPLSLPSFPDARTKCVCHGEHSNHSLPFVTHVRGLTPYVS